MRVIDDMNVGWRILLWPEVALHPDYPFKDELPYNFRQEDDKYSRCFCQSFVRNLSSPHPTYTAHEGPASIRYKCLVPIYVFPEMKLLFANQNYNVLSPSSYTHRSVRDLYISRIGLPIYSAAGKYVD